MKSATPCFDDEMLAEQLNAAVDATDAALVPLRLVDRIPLIRQSTHFQDVLICADAFGNELKIQCKYGGGMWGPQPAIHMRHCGGIQREAYVYRNILANSGVSSVRYFGSSLDEGCEHLLFIEHVENALRGSQAIPAGAGILAAAAWIGRFHWEHEVTRSEGVRAGVLPRYDRAYFSEWLDQMQTMLAKSVRDTSWLVVLFSSGDWLDTLLSSPATVIHGEYTPDNVLWSQGSVFPIDWESAAIGPGEIDLAMLTDGWEPDVEAAAIDGYCQARWNGQRPEDFEHRLALARVYVHSRWLGDARVSDRESWRVERLREQIVAAGIS